MEITILGCGEAFEPKLGNNSLLLSRARMDSILFDCGYQIPERFWNLPIKLQKLGAIVLTHFHPDHSFGILPLVTRLFKEDGGKKLTIISQGGARGFLKNLFNLGFPGIWPEIESRLSFLKLSEGRSVLHQGLKFSAARTIHSQKNISIKVEPISESREKPRHSFGVSGDGAMTPETLKLFRGVDILFQEVYSLKKRGLVPNHFSLQQLLEYGEEGSLRVKRVGVMHVSRHERARVEKEVKKLKQKFKKQTGISLLLPTPGEVIPL
jgi:ribonuclease Z